MKRLKKLKISPEKIMQNEELINLNGGYDGGGCGWYQCTCHGDSVPTTWLGYYCNPFTEGIMKWCYDPVSAQCKPV